ncbi:molybdopterin-dependent oxidoreductase [Vibrio sp. PP-XX7]
MRKLPQDLETGFQAVTSPQHESAVKHVTGQAMYIDDMPEWPNELHIATGQSTEAHAEITVLNLDQVRAYPGVIDVIIQADIPGDADVSPVLSGDLLLSGDVVHYVGQPIFAVAATSLRAAKQAVALAEITHRPLPATLHPQEALARQAFVLPTHTISCGDVKAAMDAAPYTLQSEIYLKGQEHFYLEGQISVAVPDEDGGVLVYASSQHPAEVQKLVAKVLGIPVAQVLVEVRQNGRWFRGKESQAATLSCMAAIMARRNRCPVKYRMPVRMIWCKRASDTISGTVMRLAFQVRARFSVRPMIWSAKCGCTADLSDGVVDRAMFHADNAYYLPNARISGYRAKTHTVSSTAFQGLVDHRGCCSLKMSSRRLPGRWGKIPLIFANSIVIRRGRTPHRMDKKIEEDVLLPLIEALEESADYRALPGRDCRVQSNQSFR